ncbi:MAG: cupredoxin domain-containing protein [Longimicrobiales bacterium]
MTLSELMVLAASAAGIMWIYWYFFLAPARAVATASRRNGVQEVRVLVRGGYQPALIRVRRGERVRLVFDRQETSSCSEEIVIPDFGVRRFLPAFETTVIELTPHEAGVHEFACGMSMLHGKLIVED